MAKNIDQIEREWFAQRYPGATALTPLPQMQRYFYTKELGGSTPQTPLMQLERDWLRKFISNYGVTPPSTRYTSELWTYAVIAIGQSPTPYIRDNKRKVYSVLPQEFTINKSESITLTEAATLFRTPLFSALSESISITENTAISIV